MIDRFLKAKHWQLFLLIIGIPMVFQFLTMSYLFTSFSQGSEPNPESIVNFMTPFSIMMVLFMAVLYGWYWSIAIGLQRVIPKEFKLKVIRYKIFFFIPMVYMLFFMTYFMSSFGTDGPNPAIFAIIMPLHLFSMFCLFYCLYFIAKTFKTAELQRKVTFSDFAGEFFLFWFFPIGVWVVQPKINKMVGDEFSNH